MAKPPKGKKPPQEPDNQDFNDTISSDEDLPETVTQEVAADDTTVETVTAAPEQEPPATQSGVARGPSRRMVQVLEEEKPRSNIFSLLLIIALVFTITAIVLICVELNEFYDCTFGGIVSPPQGGEVASAAVDQPASPAAPAETPPSTPPPSGGGK